MEDHDVDSWVLRWYSAMLPGFSGADHPCYGEILKDIIGSDPGLQLGRYREMWVNGNWADPEDQDGEKLLGFLRDRSVSIFAHRSHNIDANVSWGGVASILSRQWKPASPFFGRSAGRLR